MSTLHLTINGAKRTESGPLTLAGLLDRLALDRGAVVVERNREIVRRAQLGDVQVADGDVIELVHFVGGG